MHIASGVLKSHPLDPVVSTIAEDRYMCLVSSPWTVCWKGNDDNLQNSLTLGQFFGHDSQFQEGFLISKPWQGHTEDVNRQLDKIGSN